MQNCSTCQHSHRQHFNAGGSPSKCWYSEKHGKPIHAGGMGINQTWCQCPHFQFDKESWAAFTKED